METFPSLSLWPEFQVQSTVWGRHCCEEKSQAPASWQKLQQFGLISCIVRDKVGCSFVLYRRQKSQKTKGKDVRISELLVLEGRVNIWRESWGAVGWLAHPGQPGHPSLREHLLNWIMSSEAERSHVTLKCIKMSMHVLVVQWEKPFGVPAAFPMVQRQEGKKKWLTAVSLLSPSSTKHEHNYPKTRMYQGVSITIHVLCQYCSRNVFLLSFSYSHRAVSTIHVHASGVPQTSQNESGPQLVLFNLAVLMVLIFFFNYYFSSSFQTFSPLIFCMQQ